MENTFTPKGMEILKKAVIADNNDELEKALSLYKQGLGYLMTGLKYQKNDKVKATIRAKMTEYMGRAEEIKAALDQGKGKKKAIKTGEGGKGTSDEKGEDDDKDDSETAKLKGALSSAIVTETPNVKWADVAGLEQAKGLLKEAVILPIKFPQLFTGKRKAWKGILLYGPPGTGKSYLAKAVATEAGASTFLSVSSSDLVSKFQGESERLVRNLFEIAREKAPSIIFIDEVDSLCGARGDGGNDSGRRIITEFLVQMQGVGKGNDGVLVLGATNTPWQLDSAIRRRFEKRIYIPLPDINARGVIFKVHVGTTPNNLEPSDYKNLAKATDGFSGSDISVIVHDALYEPVRVCQIATHFKKIPDPEGKQDHLWTPCSPSDSKAVEMNLMDIESTQLKPPDVCAKHFEAVVARAKPSVGPDDLTQLEEWTQQFGQEG